MEWNWDDRIETTLTKTLIVQSGHEPAPDEMAKMTLPAVFKIENDVANNPATSISRNSGIEMERAMRAVGAGERVCDCAIKRLGTFRAEGRHDSGNFRFALVAKIFADLHRPRANGARRRIKQRRGRANETRCREHLF